MGLRQIKMSVDIDECFTAILLDNGEIVVDCNCNVRHDKTTILLAIEAKIDAMSGYIQRLHLVRDLLLVEDRVEEVVKPFDTVRMSSHGPCCDCDQPSDLIRSQWGSYDGDLICHECEALREHEYGIPPID